MTINNPERPTKDAIVKKFHRATVSFTQNDLDRLEELKTAFDFPSNALTVSMAIKLAAEIVRLQELGGKIIIDDKGKQKEMLIPGLTKT